MFPLVIDTPNLTLQGEVVADGLLPSANDPGLPVIDAGGSADNVAIFARTGHRDAAGLFVEDTAGDGSRLTGFELTGGGSQAVWVDRVSSYRIDHNWATANGCIALASQASSGAMDHNLATNNGCGGFAPGAGSTAHPATVLVDSNAAYGNGILGLIAGGTAFAIVPGVGDSTIVEPWDTTDPPDHLSLTVSNNSFTGNGVTGIRLFAYPPVTIPGQSTSHTSAVVINNDLSGNFAYGLVADPGFTRKHDPRTFTATLDLTLQGNTWSNNGVSSAMFGFLTIWSMLKPDCGSSSAYKQLDYSSYRVTTYDDLGNFDRYAVGDGNVLTVNGAVVHGSQLPQLLPGLGGFCH